PPRSVAAVSPAERVNVTLVFPIFSNTNPGLAVQLPFVTEPAPVVFNVAFWKPVATFPEPQSMLLTVKLISIDDSTVKFAVPVLLVAKPITLGPWLSE
ncbi:MAG TPA: hypothetical protein VI544_00135, partial [Candidatus Nanoarchaeia archaeon]|nr:hypothetical protein [Candidatus Nanoarchaeia archaeon]